MSAHPFPFEHPAAVALPSMFGGQGFVFEFSNGYGASVVCTPFSHGGEEGLWEVAVLLGGALCYTTPVTDDVVGWLSPRGAAQVLDEICRLDAASSAVTGS